MLGEGVTEKRAYSPAEFAKLFGRERTWTYRLRDSGKIKVITDYGRMMVPHSEIARIEADTTQRKAKKASSSEDRPLTEEKARGNGNEPASSSSQWNAWVKSKKPSQGEGKVAKKGVKFPGPKRPSK